MRLVANDSHSGGATAWRNHQWRLHLGQHVDMIDRGHQSSLKCSSLSVRIGGTRNELLSITINRRFFTSSTTFF